MIGSTMSSKSPRVLLCSGVTLVALGAVMLFNSCGREEASKTKEPPEMSSRDIMTVMEAHVDELMKIPGVAAVAIGELEDKTPCIKVYVIEKTAEIEENIPAELEGHPVVVEVSGEIKPMSGD